jgi:hypothetical protein
MPITAFTIGVSRTINLGNFESLRVESSITWELSADQGVEQQKELAQVQLRGLLEQTYKQYAADKKKSA